MDYIIFKADGSLDKKVLKQYIQQGSTGVNKFFVTYPGALSTDIAQVVFTLPNKTTNTELGTFESQYEYEPSVKADGWLFTLTGAQTIYNGLLMCSLRVIRGNDVLVNYPFALVINETGVKPETDSGVTIEEIDSYLAFLQNLTFIQVDDRLLSNSENPVQNKVLYNAFQDVDATYLKKSEYKNQKVSAGTTSFADDATVKFVGGSNVTITPNGETNEITIAANDTNTWRPVTIGGENIGSNELIIAAGDNVSITKSGNTFYINGQAAGEPTVDTNYYHSTGSWSGWTYTAQNNGSVNCPDLAFTLPSGSIANGNTGLVSGGAIYTALEEKVTKTNLADKIYGTDGNGNQVVIDKSEFATPGDVAQATEIYGGTKTVSELNNLGVPGLLVVNRKMFTVSDSGTLNGYGTGATPIAVKAGDRVILYSSDPSTLPLNWVIISESADRFVAKHTPSSSGKTDVYAVTNVSGSPLDVYIEVSAGVTNNAIVVRNSAGQVPVPITPSANSDAASKGYVDTVAGGLTDTNYYLTNGSWSGNTYTFTSNGGNPTVSFTIPTGSISNGSVSLVTGGTVYSYLTNYYTKTEVDNLVRGNTGLFIHEIRSSLSDVSPIKIVSNSPTQYSSLLSVVQALDDSNVVAIYISLYTYFITAGLRNSVFYAKYNSSDGSATFETLDKRASDSAVIVSTVTKTSIYSDTVIAL